MIHINDIISERYKVQAVIGHGGMSDVYEARDIIFKRIVALKILKEEAAKKVDNIIRFQNEARFSSSLNHINIIKIYDYGELENTLFIVNEFAKGQTLREALDFKRSFSINEACSIMLQLCDALIYVHSKSFKSIFTFRIDDFCFAGIIGRSSMGTRGKSEWYSYRRSR